MDENGNDEIAGIHLRFAWVKGRGEGRVFLLVGDNLRGKIVTLNGETLCKEQRLIPYRNTIGIGNCFFKFATQTTAQEE